MHPVSAWRAIDALAHHALCSVYLLRKAYAGPLPDTPFPLLDVGLSQGEKQQASRVLTSLCRRADSATRGARHLHQCHRLQALQRGLMGNLRGDLSALLSTGADR